MDPFSKKPEDNAFQQQRLKAWQPLLTPPWVIGTFATVGPIWLAIGIAVLITSQGVVEKEVRYEGAAFTPGFEDVCDPDKGGNGTYYPYNSDCFVDVTLTLDKDMDRPVFVYYKLTNFYQNHRRYVKSRSDAQLRGEETNEGDIESCDPLVTMDEKMLYPCGLIANSFFNDTINATINGVPLTGDSWDGSNIAWKSDVRDKFKEGSVPRPTPDETNIGSGNFPLPPVTNQDFIVWMRTAGLPTFKKLYRIINDKDLKEGDTLTFSIANAFPVKGFSGTKSIVLSTTSSLGGKNDFLGIAYIVVGCICIVLAVAFFAKHKISPRPLGDMKYFNWPGSRAAAGPSAAAHN